MFNNKSEASLLSIQEQINKFDNKANSLITIVGIIFALSLGILDTFNQFVNVELVGKFQVKFYCLIVFSVLYFISFLVEMIFLILVIYPRRKKEGKVSLTYYMDASNLSKDEIRDILNSDENNDLESDIDQIKSNAIICRGKHKFLIVAIWLLVPLFLFMFAVFFTAIL